MRVCHQTCCMAGHQAPCCSRPPPRRHCRACVKEPESAGSRPTAARRGARAQGCPPVDLLLRTSGEARLSDFLLWQAGGAQLAFARALWPELGFADLLRALVAWQAARPRLAVLRAAAAAAADGLGATRDAACVAADGLPQSWAAGAGRRREAPSAERADAGACGAAARGAAAAAAAGPAAGCSAPVSVVACRAASLVPHAEAECRPARLWDSALPLAADASTGALPVSAIVGAAAPAAVAARRSAPDADAPWPASPPAPHAAAGPAPGAGEAGAACTAWLADAACAVSARPAVRAGAAPALGGARGSPGGQGLEQARPSCAQGAQACEAGPASATSDGAASARRTVLAVPATQAAAAPAPDCGRGPVRPGAAAAAPGAASVSGPDRAEPRQRAVPAGVARRAGAGAAMERGGCAPHAQPARAPRASEGLRSAAAPMGQLLLRRRPCAAGPGCGGLGEEGGALDAVPSAAITARF